MNTFTFTVVCTITIDVDNVEEARRLARLAVEDIQVDCDASDIPYEDMQVLQITFSDTL